MSRRTDWILFLLAGGESNPHEVPPLDPIRIMKGLCRAQVEDADGNFVQDADPPFDFQPYSYGPFTPVLYTELEYLRAMGIVESAEVYGKSYSMWTVSLDSWPAVGKAEQRLTDDGRKRLRSAYQIGTSYSFDDLLRYVSSRHPESATASVHRAASG
jgi:hypothetical protein